jgi:hypothetical protein
VEWFNTGAVSSTGASATWTVMMTAFRAKENGPRHRKPLLNNQNDTGQDFFMQEAG